MIAELSLQSVTLNFASHDEEFADPIHHVVPTRSRVQLLLTQARFQFQFQFRDTNHGMNPPQDPANEENAHLDLLGLPRPHAPPRVHVVIQINWLNMASIFLENPLQHPDIIDWEVMMATTENELQFPVDVVKQTFTNYIWLFHQRYLRRREFSLKLIHPHSSQVIPMNFDDTWADILTAQAIPRNIGVLQLEVQMSPIHVWDCSPWPVQAN